MKHRKKGRKIYTYQAKNRRVFSDYHPMRSAIGTAVTLLLVIGLGIVGYNVIGPIVIRAHEEEINPTTTPEPFFTEAAPAQTIAAAEVVQTSYTEATTTVLLTTATETVTTEVTTSGRYPADLEIAYYMPEDALKDLDAVEDAAQKCAQQGYRTMILPLKQESGMLQYASSVDKAMTCGACNENMLTLREIQNAAKRYHVDCAALFYTLADHTYPNYFMEGSYVFQEGNTRWLDNKPEEGGQPWLNPFDPAAGEYLAGLAAEIQRSGFTRIICTGTVFPHFFQSDADLLGGQVLDENKRRDALLSVVNKISDTAPSAGMMVDLYALAQGEEEAFVPNAVRMECIYVQINPNEFDEAFTVGERRVEPSTLAFREKTELLAEVARSAAGAHNTIPCLSGSSMTPAELETAIAVLYENGFKTICIF